MLLCINQRILLFILNFFGGGYFTRTGGALKNTFNIEELPEVGVNDTVLHIQQDEAQSPTEEMPERLETLRVLCHEDIVNQSASITYEASLRQLVNFLQLPFDRCPVSTKKTACDARAPFEIEIKRRGTATVIEWVSSTMHIWSYCSLFIHCFHKMPLDAYLLSSVLLIYGFVIPYRVTKCLTFFYRHAPTAT